MTRLMRLVRTNFYNKAIFWARRGRGGPIAHELSNMTTYVAAITSLQTSDDVKGFLEFLEMPTAQRILNAAGIV